MPSLVTARDVPEIRARFTEWARDPGPDGAANWFTFLPYRHEVACRKDCVAMSGDATVNDHVVCGLHAGIGPGHTLEAAAARLAEDIGELRADGGLPPDVRTVVTVLPQQRRLDILVDGLSVEADPDRTTIREVMNSLFELASFHNIVVLDEETPPLFTQRILLIGPDGQPFAAMIGTAVGDVEPLSSLLFGTTAEPRTDT